MGQRVMFLVSTAMYCLFFLFFLNRQLYKKKEECHGSKNTDSPPSLSEKQTKVEIKPQTRFLTMCMLKDLRASFYTHSTLVKSLLCAKSLAQRETRMETEI